MDLPTAIALLSGVVSAGAGVAQALAVLRSPDVPPDVVSRVRALPPSASAHAIVAAVLESRGGNTSVLGGTGPVQIEGAYISGGHGLNRGGDTVVQAGPGGMTIVGGVIKGGDAGPK
jgi:hypothetical protein